MIVGATDGATVGADDGAAVPTTHALAPTAELYPLGQLMHVVLLAAGWYVPAAHVKQNGSLVVLVYVPGAHPVQRTEPVAPPVEDPTAHAVHATDAASVA